MGEGSGCEVTQKQATRAQCGFGFKDRTGFVERVIGIRQFVEIVCQNVRAKILENTWKRFRVLEKFDTQCAFCGFRNGDCCLRISGLLRATEDRADAHVGILQVWRSVAIQREKFVPREDVICEPVLREFRILHRSETDCLCGRFDFVGR